jgi:HEAT repeat protein
MAGKSLRTDFSEFEHGFKEDTMANDNNTLKKLRALTKDREGWKTRIDDVSAILDEDHPDEVKAKALWLLGEMGLKHPNKIEGHINAIVAFMESENPKLRERSLNALGRIGRADESLVIPYMEKLMEMKDDESENVRHAFIWACENIAMTSPELFCENLEIFYRMIFDSAEKVRIEAPEMFRVMGKAIPQCVMPYLEKLERISQSDEHPVVRIHSAGAIRMTKKALGAK